MLITYIRLIYLSSDDQKCSLSMILETKDRLETTVSSKGEIPVLFSALLGLFHHGENCLLSELLQVQQCCSIPSEER